MVFCLECGNDMVASCGPITEQYRGVDFTVEGIEHLSCPYCGEYSLTAAASRELTRQIAGKYAEQNGLLRPDEIYEIRKNLGLSQAEFQQMLGVTGVAASRWETGKCQQSKSVDLLMREIKEHDCVAEDLLNRAGIRRRCSDEKVLANSSKKRALKLASASAAVLA